MRIHFLGANRQVTGSRYVLEAQGLRVMIDCGLFQERAHLCRNWAPSPTPPRTIDHLLLTHAHLDHCGLIPRLRAEGFEGAILATAATRDLADIVLYDAAAIQEEDAAYKRKRHECEGRTGPYPVKPLYTERDVRDVMPLFRSVRYREPVALNDEVSVTFHDAGHILGSSLLEVVVRSDGALRRIVFSGDLGQKGKPIVHDPTVLNEADYVIMESTYGDRQHGNTQTVEDQLAEVLGRAMERGGKILIPTFAVERAQELLFYLGRLMHRKRLPHTLVFLDSPMAVDVTDVFRGHRALMDKDMQERLASGRPMFDFPGLHLVRSRDESKAINRIRGSCIILAGSGMCTAGRIKHHLANNISQPDCTVIFVGYQAQGTLGREILEGKNPVRIHGKMHTVRAAIEEIHGLSAHADQSGLLDWVGHIRKPRRVFLTHGEEEAAGALAGLIQERFGWDVTIPEYGDVIDLA